MHKNNQQPLAQDLDRLRAKRAFICDMDGVIYHGDRLLDGVPSFVQWLQAEGKQFIFLTNSSERAPRELQQKLMRMGLDVGDDHFYTSALATASFLRHQSPGCSVYVIGEPGLVGALIVGVSAAKALAYSLSAPFVGVNHMEGHIYANWLASAVPDFPALGLIVSGGHTALMIVEDHGRYRLLGQTRDDAAGEAYDKIARALGLGYPGGPALDKLAGAGDPGAHSFPKVYLRDGSWNFSFSGLKTAVLNLMNQLEMKGQPIHKADIAASFQEVVTESLTYKTVEAAKAFGISRVLLAGGVAANSGLRRKMLAARDDAGINVFIPEPALCTDNAAMIACAGYHRLRAGFRDSLSMNAEPSLDMMAM